MMAIVVNDRLRCTQIECRRQSNLEYWVKNERTVSRKLRLSEFRLHRRPESTTPPATPVPKLTPPSGCLAPERRRGLSLDQPAQHRQVFHILVHVLALGRFQELGDVCEARVVQDEAERPEAQQPAADVVVAVDA